MKQDFGEFFAASLKSTEQATQLMNRLFDAAGHRAVFGEPVVAGERTVITANETMVGMGFGIGTGGGPGSQPGAGAGETSPAAPPVPAVEGATFGAGSGGGGGGYTFSRPVAVIVVSADGVEVRPIVDVTKITVTFFTTFFALMAAQLITRRRLRKLRSG